MKPCPSLTAKSLATCEPMSKACKRAISMAQVAYKLGKTSQLTNSINYETNKEEKVTHYFSR